MRRAGAVLSLCVILWSYDLQADPGLQDTLYVSVCTDRGERFLEIRQVRRFERVDPDKLSEKLLLRLPWSQGE